MITSIPEGQTCQAFDPMMYLPEKTLNIIGVDQNANTSCVAPAYIYMEGSHGKRFLCDYHYQYEKNMTKGNKTTAHLWPQIEEFIIDERERIRDTFAKNVTTTETLGHKCSLKSTHNPEYMCTADAFIKVIGTEILSNKINFTDLKDFKKGNHWVLYCNFHFRKNYYRYYSNGVNYEDIHEIIDERSRMNITIAEESDSLSLV